MTAPVPVTNTDDLRARLKLEGGKAFVLQTEFEPAGDQPTAISELVQGVQGGEHNQVLLGATGTGKTFTMAKVIEQTQRPALILAPNKTLAAQLYGEFKGFFPENAVEYFVSYYDYYQPEAYVARSDTFIEKESQINEQIDRMRHAATRALLERDDVIIVASVSCIYGIGSVETYGAMTQDLQADQSYDHRQIIADLVAQQYRRNDQAFQRGAFRVRGDALEIFPAHLDDRAWRLSFFGDDLENITEFDPLTGEKTQVLDQVRVYANSHYVTPKPTINQAIINIKKELRQRLDQVGEWYELEGRGSLGRMWLCHRVQQRAVGGTQPLRLAAPRRHAPDTGARAPPSRTWRPCTTAAWSTRAHGRATAACKRPRGSSSAGRPSWRR